MPKLMICAPRWGQSTPKVRAICATCPSPSAANKRKAIITVSLAGVRLGLNQKQSVKDDRFRKSDTQNGLDQYFGRCAGVAPDGDRCARPDQADTDRCACCRQTDMDVAAHECQWQR